MILIKSTAILVLLFSVVAAHSLFNCANKDDGSYPDPQQNCSRVFYKCAGGNVSQVDCAHNKFFDVDTKDCKAREAVAACAGKHSEAPAGEGQEPAQQRVKPTQPPAVTEKIPIDCTNLVTGQYPDPANKCSKIYYVCVNGLGVKLSCPGGLYYDPKSKACDYFNEVFVCSGKQKPATTIAPKPKPKPSPASLLTNEFNCSDKKDGSYLPPSKKCSEYYFKCFGGFTLKATCPRGLYYDIAKDQCVTFANLFVCSGKNPTSRKPPTTTQPRPTIKLPIDCSKLADGDYPDPEKKCSSVYYTCSNAAGARRICPQVTFFDKTYSVCDARENVPDCGGKARPPTTRGPKQPTPAFLPSLSFEFDCKKRDEGNYASGKCAPNFWVCVGSLTLRGACPPGTFYDAELNECGFKEQIPACGGVRPTPTVSAPTKSS